MRKIKMFFDNLFLNKDNKRSVNKLLTLIAFLNAILELGLCQIHNKAMFSVRGTIAIYGFFYLILVLLSAINAMRLSEDKKYYIFSYVCLTACAVLGSVYIIKCLNDEYYLNALNGLIRDPYTIVWPIEDACLLMGVGVAFNVVCITLTTIELILRKKQKEE